MKHYSIIGLFCALVCSAVCQAQKAPIYTASVSEEDRITLVRSNIPLTDWHEQSFWAQYKDYLDKLNAVSSLVYGVTSELAHVDETTSKEKALETGSKLIAYCWDELALRREYFVEIGREHNGIIGLQFLQTETLLDIVESSGVYDGTPWQNVQYTFSTLPSRQAKQGIMTKALALSPEEALVFFAVYQRYELESEEILGEEYTLYDLFSTEASDFTPALAKRQGYDFLTVMGREIMLKDKYFKEMNVIAGPLLAARFLAWEDYFSMRCKMSVWTAR